MKDEKEKETDLKTLAKSVENVDAEMEYHPSIKALVRFLARRAAENDYNELLEVLKSNPDYGMITSDKEKL